MTYTIPAWYVDPLLTGNYKDLSQHEERIIDNWQEKIIEENGPGVWRQITKEWEFFLTNDVEEDLPCETVLMEFEPIKRRNANVDL